MESRLGLIEHISTGLVVLAYKEDALDWENIDMRITGLDNFDNNFCEMFCLTRGNMADSLEYKNYYSRMRETLVEGYKIAYCEIDIKTPEDIDNTLKKFLVKEDTKLLGIEY